MKNNNHNDHHPLPAQLLFCTHLLHKKERDSLKHLISIEGSDSHVEEESIQHRCWDVGEGVRQQKDGESDEDVGEQSRKTCLSHLDNAEKKNAKSVNRQTLPADIIQLLSYVWFMGYGF